MPGSHGVSSGGEAIDHDHVHCVEEALNRADALCAEGGARLTALRRKVLREVWRGHDAVKAYEILERLGDAERTAKPPTVYRALQFLQERGLVHRLESLNAFVGCAQPRRAHQGQFLICRDCGQVREIHARRITEAVDAAAHGADFLPERQMVEVTGQCAQCR